MKVAVGSQNKNKITAVKEAVSLYPEVFSNAVVEGVAVDIKEFGHPKTIEAITNGAVDRAKQAFGERYAYSFGIESGLMPVPHTKSGYIEIQACAIYDGAQVSMGFSTGFEWPTGVIEKILEGNVDGSAAFRELGYTDEEKMGNVSGGIIGLLTEGRMTREQQVHDSIVMAMVQFEKREWYK